MTITINYSPQASAGYVPRKSLTLHNVESVQGNGVGMVRVHTLFTDDKPTHDHVVSVLVIPEKVATGKWHVIGQWEER